MPHRCQSSINTVTRGRTQGLIGRTHRRADGCSVEFLVTILRGHQTCPSAGANPTVKGETRNTLMVELRKATKGRRMSKKTRKKSSKPAPKSRKTPAPKPAAAKSARKAAQRSDATSAKKPAAKTAAKTAPRRPAGCQNRAKRPSASRRRPKRLRPSVEQPPSKPLNQSIGPPNRMWERNWSRADASPSAPRDGGGKVSLADYAGKKLVLSSIPRRNPGCTGEPSNHAARSYLREGAAVLGLSADT